MPMPMPVPMPGLWRDIDRSVAPGWL